MAYRESPLPKEIDIRNSAIPAFTSAGDPAKSAWTFTSTLTDITQLAFANTNSVGINVTVVDGRGIQVANLSSYTIDVNQPYVLLFNPPIRCVSGFQVYANSTGVDLTAKGWCHPGFTAQ